MERTLVLIKPDGVERGLVGEILSRFEKKGLKIVGLQMLKMDHSLAEKHYAEHKDQPFFAGLINFMTSSPIIAAIIEGEGAVVAVRSLMGCTNPLKSPPGTIRGDYGLVTSHNLIHGSDSLESAKREIELFFSN